MGVITKHWRPLAALLLGMLLITFDRQILGLIQLREMLPDLPYLWSTILNLFDIFCMAAAFRIVASVSFADQWKAVGLNKPVVAALLFAAILFVPAILLSAIFEPISGELKPTDLFFKGVFFPLTEEILFRGLAIGILLVYFGWRFLPAALLPAIFFGLFHASQGNDLIDAASLAAITGAGGLLFGWLYMRWGHNLWPAFFVHAGLNSVWLIFDQGTNAIGGWLGNGIRIAVVAGAIGLSIWCLEWMRRKSSRVSV